MHFPFSFQNNKERAFKKARIARHFFVLLFTKVDVNGLWLSYKTKAELTIALQIEKMRISFKKGFWTVKEISRIGSSKINMVYSSVSL